jgi:amino acid adenylation domain-containing protein
MQIAFIEESGYEISYSDLLSHATRVALFLQEKGVRPGARVGMVLPRSIDSIAITFGLLMVGASRVSLDIFEPAHRIARIFQDCQPELVFASEGLKPSPAEHGNSKENHPQWIEIKGGFDRQFACVPATWQPPELFSTVIDSIAQIAYTSGSTGAPKGVCLSHRSVDVFSQWYKNHLKLTNNDRLSVVNSLSYAVTGIDIHATIAAQATGIIISEKTLRDPRALLSYVEKSLPTSWCSVPAVLRSLADAAREGHASLPMKSIVYCGANYPVGALRELAAVSPFARLYNSYGTTELGSWCLLKEIDRSKLGETTEVSLGGRTPHFDFKLEVDDAGIGKTDGELLASGPTLATGYWNSPELSAAKFQTDANGSRWCRTGDILRRDISGEFSYVGRVDRMIKKNGIRLELGEIEYQIDSLPMVKQAAVVATTALGAIKITAFVVPKKGQSVSIIALKAHCAKTLPLGVTPDQFRIIDELPLTTNGKVDFPKLQREVEIS